ncbi:MAG: arginine--tRNA ligase [Nitrospiraceae bacterium]|nr:MAG: arginine--tRNA ligase [Nitrospiraceae bacterium]
MKQEVVEIIRKALESLQEKWGLECLPDIDIEVPKNEKMGDVATTIAMGLTKSLKRPPKKIAEEIVDEIRGGFKGGDIFESVEIAGPGFINFRLKNEFLHAGLEQLLIEEHSSLRADMGKGHKVQVEFVSANPTGPLHVGHGRGAAVGNALCNIMEAAGFEVQKEFYINDAGLQVKLLGESVFARYLQMSGYDAPFPEDGYKGDYIETVAEEIIKRAGDEYLNKTIEECGDFFSDYAYKMMLADIERDLKDFGVVFDRWQSEKELYERGSVQSALAALHEKTLLYEKDGARWFISTRFGDDKDRVVVKQDGEYTYFASDIAYHKDKLDRGFDTIINIWGADHHGYIPRIKSVLEAFGLPKEKFRVILIQMVALLRHGEPVQMSKRAGEFVTLREVIDEVGSDITKFIFLTRRADSQLEFDIEVAKEQSAENPVFYVQYAFARISSIFRQAAEKRVRGFEGSRVQDVGAGFKPDLSSTLALLTENEELSLIKKLLQYPMVFEGAALSCEPHRITYYLQELAGMFHSYYNKHRVISDNEELTNARLCLCRAVQIVLKEGLSMLGVSAPERM